MGLGFPLGGGGGGGYHDDGGGGGGGGGAQNAQRTTIYWSLLSSVVPFKKSFLYPTRNYNLEN